MISIGYLLLCIYLVLTYIFILKNTIGFAINDVFLTVNDIKERKKDLTNKNPTD